MSFYLRIKPRIFINGLQTKMTTQSYAQIAGNGSMSTGTKKEATVNQNQAPTTSQDQTPRRRRSSSSSSKEPNQDHIPKTAQKGEDVYVLVFRTDRNLHQQMTALRKQYFPPERNKVTSHLTLFHALPESRLKSDIYPAIERVAAEMNVFNIRVGEPRRMSKGFMLPIKRDHGSEPGYACHSRLLEAWQKADFLSQQDTGKLSMHYTIMNFETDEEKIKQAMDEVKQKSTHPHGKIIGLDLYRYKPWGWTPAGNWAFRDEATNAEVKHT